MSVSKPVNLDVDVRDRSGDIEATAAEMENVLAVLASEWDMEDELAGSEIELLIGAGKPMTDDSSIAISGPEAYDEFVRNEFPDNSMRSRALGFVGPYHEMFEEAGHYLSKQHVDRSAESYQDTVVNEFFGGLGMEAFDPELIEWELETLQENMSEVRRMNSPGEVTYVLDNLERFESTVEEYLSELGEVDSEEDFVELVRKAARERSEEFDRMPSDGSEFEYSRFKDETPKSYSEWFVDDIVFGFLKPAEDYRREEDVTYEDAVETGIRVGENRFWKIQSYDGNKAMEDARMRVMEDTAKDRGYFSGRALAARHEEPEPEELVRMGNEEIHEMFSEDVEEIDSRLQTAYVPDR